MCRGHRRRVVEIAFGVNAPQHPSTRMHVRRICGGLTGGGGGDGGGGGSGVSGGLDWGLNLVVACMVNG